MTSPRVLEGELNGIGILYQVPTYEEFLENYLRPNKPCLISPDLIHSWPATRLWTSTSQSSSDAIKPTPNWDYLLDNYGDETVIVAKCGSRSFSDQERLDLPLREVIELWKSGKGEGLYVKDWHLAKVVRERGKERFYEIPDIFLDDWMNCFWENGYEESNDDFRFVVSYRTHFGWILFMDLSLLSIWVLKGPSLLYIETCVSHQLT